MNVGTVEPPRPVLFTSGALAARLKGELLGPPGIEIRGIDTLEDAAGDRLSFVRDSKYWPAWAASRAGTTLVSRRAMPDAPPAPGRALIVVPDADASLIEILTVLAPVRSFGGGVHPGAIVDPAAAADPTAHLGPGVVIGARTTIGPGAALIANITLGEDVRIGRHTVIHPGVVVQDRCTIGDHVILHPGVVIGADGFGYRPDPATRMPAKIPHIGAVVIESHVEIGANTTIDRGKFGDTRIGAGTKIDNLVQIGHNCRIGRCCIICGMCGLAGSVTLGDGVTLAGGVGIADQRTIGAGATIAARSGVMESVPAGESWFGYPAIPARHFMRSFAALKQLPDLLADIRRLIRSQKP